MTRLGAGHRTLRRGLESSVHGLLLLCAVVSVVTTAGILFVLARETFGFFREVSVWAFLTGTEWTPLFADKKFGILPLLGGTLLTTAIALAVAIPLGLLGAIYLSEFATARLRRTLKPMLELLAGVPTVVYGYFALMVVTPALQRVIPGLAGFNALSAGMVMGIMILPIIASLSEDALHAVPLGLREGAFALGADRISTLFRVVIPAAYSGIAASIILGISRAVGETMIVAIAAGLQPRLTLDPRVPVETMTAFIVQVSMGDTPTGTLAHRTLFAVGSTLFVMTLLLNAVSHRLRQRIRKGGVL
jgi:phosphate transport system permease protein